MLALLGAASEERGSPCKINAGVNAGARATQPVPAAGPYGNYARPVMHEGYASQRSGVIEMPTGAPPGRPNWMDDPRMKAAAKRIASQQRPDLDPRVASMAAKVAHSGPAQSAWPGQVLTGSAAGYMPPGAFMAGVALVAHIPLTQSASSQSLVSGAVSLPGSVATALPPPVLSYAPNPVANQPTAPVPLVNLDINVMNKAEPGNKAANTVFSSNTPRGNVIAPGFTAQAPTVID